MGNTRGDVLDGLIADLQTRWGRQALTSGSEFQRHTTRQFVSTGYSDLDALLSGGILRSEVTLMIGDVTSGATTVACATIAQVHQNGGYAVFIDIAETFDPFDALKRGVDLTRLLVVRPPTALEGIEIAIELISRTAVSVLVLDFSLAPLLATSRLARSFDALQKLQLAVRRSTGAIIITATGSDTLFRPLAGVVVRLTHRRWLFADSALVGYESQAEIEKSPPGNTGRSALFTVVLEGRGIEGSR